MRRVLVIALAGLAGCSTLGGGGEPPGELAGGGSADAGPAADGHVEPGAGDAAIGEPDGLELPPLTETLAELGQQIETATGGEVSIALTRLATGEHGSYKGDALHISASSAKAFWVAAAIDGAGVAAVAPFAEPIFTVSDNYAAGSAIDLIGPNAVNTFLWDAGMNDTALTSWSFGQTRVADNSPRRLGGNNYFSANDSTRFVTLLESGELLDDYGTSVLLGWMQLSPRAGYGGWAGDELPMSARDTYRHKAGWLPPGCCSSDPHTLVDIGAVDVGPDETYAYAILMRYGDWDAQAAAAGEAGCRLYQLFDPSWSCGN